MGKLPESMSQKAYKEVDVFLRNTGNRLWRVFVIAVFVFVWNISE